jgi:uncharacterized membrane protein
MRWLGYFWRVTVNCFYIFIILLVFDKLYHKPEAVTVAVLGLIYVTIRSIAIGQHMGFVQTMFALDRQVLNIRRLLNDPGYEEMKDAVQETEKPGMGSS